jgi:amino acid transporter
MGIDVEKKLHGDDAQAGVFSANNQHAGSDVDSANARNPYAFNEEEAIYDPSLESKWTRAGLTMESFKRAPGTTRYVCHH